MMFGKKRTPEEDVMSLKEQRAMLGDRLSFAASEAYKLLRTNLTFALPDEQRCRVVGITSASRGEGKSTTSINLAYTIAETGKRVLLVEADMRRPNLARRLAIDPAPGLSNLLAGLCRGCPHQPGRGFSRAGRDHHGRRSPRRTGKGRVCPGHGQAEPAV